MKIPKGFVTCVPKWFIHYVKGLQSENDVFCKLNGWQQFEVILLCYKAFKLGKKKAREFPTGE